MSITSIILVCTTLAVKPFLLYYGVVFRNYSVCSHCISSYARILFCHFEIRGGNWFQGEDMFSYVSPTSNYCTAIPSLMT